MLEVFHDGGLEVVHAMEDPAANTFFGDVSEEPFDEIHPGGGGGGEVHMEPWVLFEPCSHVGMLVGGVVVDDQVHVQFRVGFTFQRLEELQELVMAVFRHALADHVAGFHIQGGKEGRRAMAFVVMRQGAALAGFHRQARLGAIQRLNLAFLIDGKHDGLFRGVQIEADDILQLFGEPGVVGYLEPLDLMRLQGVLFPDPVDRHAGNAHVLCQGPATPVGGMRGFAREREGNHLLNLSGGERGDPRGPRLPLKQSVQPLVQIAPAPEIQGFVGDSQRCHHLVGGAVVRRHQYHTGAGFDFCRRRSTFDPTFELAAVLLGKGQFHRCLHSGHSINNAHLSGTLH